MHSTLNTKYLVIVTLRKEKANKFKIFINLNIAIIELSELAKFVDFLCC